MNKYREINSILDNHTKLLSMLNPNVAPIKEILIKDVRDIKQMLEQASKEEKK